MRIGKLESSELQRSNQEQGQLIYHGLIINKVMCRLGFLLTFFPLLMAINNFNVGIPFDGTDSPLSGAFNPLYALSFPLGVLQKGYTISIKAAIKNKNTQSLSTLTLSLYQMENNNPSTYKAISFTTTSNTAILKQRTYAITFSGSEKSAAFQLRALSSFSDFNFFSIDVVYYKTSEGPTSKKIKTILKVTETQRNTILRMVYVADPTQMFLSFYPATSAQNNFVVSLKPILESDWDLLNGWRVGSTPVATSSTYNDLLKVQTLQSDHPVPHGYYLLSVGFSTPRSKDFIRFSFQTDTYKCPYDAPHADYYKNFQGCSQKIPDLPQEGLPCLEYNENTGLCAECLPGYTIAKNVCVMNTTCPDRKYFHFGQCIAVSNSCGKYDLFTGGCITCSDPDKYTLTAKQCIPKPTFACKERQFISNQTCLDVSGSCGSFNPLTGACLSCLSNHYQLNNDGTCTSAGINCPQGYFVARNSCIPIQSECLRYHQTKGGCEICIQGHIINNGTCQRLHCPQGQTPSKNGVCVDVSILCERYDSERDICINCRRGYTLRDGKCLQMQSPLGGCRERQRLGFGQCANSTLRCKTFDVESKTCLECELGNYFDYTGHCVPQPACGQGQYSVNDECLPLPPSCLIANDRGCKQCNQKTRLVEGQCIERRLCPFHEFLGQSGECIKVQEGCATWNPSNGDCLTCLIEGVEPASGACCPTGLFFSRDQGACVAELPSSDCEIRHRALRICLRCKQGLKPDYSVPFGCSKN